MKKLLALPTLLASLVACGPQTPETAPAASASDAEQLGTNAQASLSSFEKVCGYWAPGVYDLQDTSPKTVVQGSAYVVTGYIKNSSSQPCGAPYGTVTITGFSRLSDHPTGNQVCGTVCPDVYSHIISYIKSSTCNPAGTVPSDVNSVNCSNPSGYEFWLCGQDVTCPTGYRSTAFDYASSCNPTNATSGDNNHRRCTKNP